MKDNERHCEHCDQNYDLVKLEFPSHAGWHCPTHRLECDICRGIFCVFDVKEHRDTGLILCETCSDPAIIAEHRYADLTMRKRGA